MNYFDKVLVANRGEIARRILRTCRAMGFSTVAVYSEADRGARHVAEADEAVCIGPAASAESYLVIDKILEAAKVTGAGAIHPGYGFLSENEAFARACDEAGVVFVGPTPKAIAAMGSKIEAKALMREHGVPVIPGYDGVQDTESLAAEAKKMGLPVLVKASAGGCFHQNRVVTDEADLEAAIDAARREAESSFGDGKLLMEKYIQKPRHVEFQILGDGQGTVLHLFERECSIQRRHQKVIEETPSMALSDDLRARMAAAAVAAGQALDYRSAGTVEFIVGPDGEFYFLEVNTRLQVEHPVTEMVTGLDLVELQLRVALGETLPVTQEDITSTGHSIECRLYAEDPANDFLPATGRLLDWHMDPADGLRLDSAVEAGDEVSIYYDPMIAKVVTWGRDRGESTRRMIRALEQASLHGVTTNRRFLIDVLRTAAWRDGDLSTHFIDEHFPTNAARNADPSQDIVALAAAAATLAYAESRKAAGDQPVPSLPIRWRNNLWRPARRTWAFAGEDVTIEWQPQRRGEGYSIGLPGSEASVVARDVRWEAPGLSFELDGRRWRARVVTEGGFDGVVGVHVDGHDVTLDFVTPFPDPDAETEAGGCIAPMPGKVLQVLVEPGQAVEAGQSLVVMEAMKMEHTIAAPSDGTVTEVLVEVGDLVDADDPLVRLDDALEST